MWPTEQAGSSPPVPAAGRWGASGDLDCLGRLFPEEGFTAEAVASEDLVKDDWRVEYQTFRVI